MKLRFTRRALADIAGIAAYIRRDSPAAAHRALRALDAATGRLPTFANLGRPTDEPGVRELRVAHWPYIIYYRATAGEVVNLHVRHKARRPYPDQP